MLTGPLIRLVFLMRSILWPPWKQIITASVSSGLITHNSILTMPGSFDLMVFMIMLVFPMAMSRLFASADAENYSPAFEAAGPHEINSRRELFKGKMSFDEEWKSDAPPSTCTCTCSPGGVAPEAPSQRSPVERKRSPPPPAAPYGPSPSSDAPNSKSPVSFTSPPPAAPYDDVPSYEQPSPVVVTSPQSFVPAAPPPPPVY